MAFCKMVLQRDELPLHATHKPTAQNRGVEEKKDALHAMWIAKNILVANGIHNFDELNDAWLRSTKSSDWACPGDRMWTIPSELSCFPKVSVPVQGWENKKNWLAWTPPPSDDENEKKGAPAKPKSVVSGKTMTKRAYLALNAPVDGSSDDEVVMPLPKNSRKRHRVIESEDELPSRPPPRKLPKITIRGPRRA